MDYEFKSKEVLYCSKNGIHYLIYDSIKDELQHYLQKNPTVSQLKRIISSLKNLRSISYSDIAHNCSEAFIRYQCEYDFIVQGEVIIFLEIYKRSLELQGEDLLKYYLEYPFELELIQNLLPPDKEIDITEELLKEN